MQKAPFGAGGGAGASIIIGNYNQYVNCNNVFDGQGSQLQYGGEA